MNKHPCLNCEHFKIAKSGKSYNCKHPKITENDTYQYGRGFTCTCTPKWCPQHPNRDYLGQKVKVPEGQRRETKAVIEPEAKQENKVIYAETMEGFEQREAGPDMGTPAIVKPEVVTASDPVKELPASDPVNHPDHYTDGGIETITILQAKLSDEEFRGYCRGNAIKYLSRAGKKTPDPKQDYEKAQWYLNKLVEVTE